MKIDHCPFCENTLITDIYDFSIYKRCRNCIYSLDIKFQNNSIREISFYINDNRVLFCFDSKEIYIINMQIIQLNWFIPDLLNIQSLVEKINTFILLS